MQILIVAAALIFAGCSAPAIGATNYKSRQVSQPSFEPKFVSVNQTNYVTLTNYLTTTNYFKVTNRINSTNFYQVGTNVLMFSMPTPDDSFSLTTKVCIAGIGGFLGWVLTNLVQFRILRKRLISYLIIAINFHLEQCLENKNWLQKIRQTIKPEMAIDQGAGYAADSLEDLTALRLEILKHLSESEVLKLTIMTKRLWELEELFSGFCSTMMEFKIEHKKDSQLKLSSMEADLLIKRLDRILSYMNALPSRIQSLNDLPDQYNEVISADSLVTVTPTNTVVPAAPDAPPAPPNLPPTT